MFHIRHIVAARRRKAPVVRPAPVRGLSMVYSSPSGRKAFLGKEKMAELLQNWVGQEQSRGRFRPGRIGTGWWPQLLQHPIPWSPTWFSLVLHHLNNWHSSEYTHRGNKGLTKREASGSFPSPVRSSSGHFCAAALRTVAQIGLGCQSYSNHLTSSHISSPDAIPISYDTFFPQLFFSFSFAICVICECC